MKILKKALTVAVVAFSTAAVSAQAETCNVVTQNGGLTDQLFRIMQKHNPDFRVTYRISAFNVTQVELTEKDPSFMILSPPVFFSKKNPNPNPPLEMVKVLSSSNAALVTNTGVTVEDLATKKLNIGIPAFAQYSHSLALALQDKNPNLNIIVVPAKDAPPMLTSGDLDIYIHTEPVVDRFVENFGSEKIVVVAPDKPTNINGINAKSLHFSSIWINKKATSAQRDHVLKCLAALENNSAFDEDIAKTGSTVRLNISDTERDQYLSDFKLMLKNMNM
jgi:ABC-type nitrate/sulfonate/bicarbonate transport system substrate-binding protein